MRARWLYKKTEWENPALTSDKEGPCGELPCSNTETGEAPADIAHKEFIAFKKKIRETGTDKERWRYLSLASDSSQAAGLTMPLVKAAHFGMRLDPKTGQLTFTKDGKQQTYQIANTTDRTCPVYTIRVLDASATHALIEQSCNGIEYEKNRYSASVGYFLYDPATPVLLNFYTGHSDDKKKPYPIPKPKPRLVLLENGYKLDWTGVDPTENRKFSHHAKYVRKRTVKDKSEITYLACIDAKDPKGEESGGICEANNIDPINNAK